MNPYSNDLRLRAVQAYERGEGSLLDLARRYEISKDTLRTWCRRYRKNATVTPLPHRGGSKSILNDEDRRHVIQSVAERNDATLEELSDDLFVQRGVRVGRTTISNIVLQHDLTLKKRRCVQPSAKCRNGKPSGKHTSKK